MPKKLTSYAITVYPNGDLPYPDDINGEIIGNLARNSLEDLLSSRRAEELRKKMLENAAKYEYLHLQTASFNNLKDLAEYVREMGKWAFTGHA